MSRTNPFSFFDNSKSVVVMENGILPVADGRNIFNLPVSSGGLDNVLVTTSSVNAIANNRYVCEVYNGVVVNLPVASNGDVVAVSAQELGEGKCVTINPASGDSIAGEEVLEINISYGYVELFYHGDDWRVVLPFVPFRQSSNDGGGSSSGGEGGVGLNNVVTASATINAVSHNRYICNGKNNTSVNLPEAVDGDIVVVSAQSLNTDAKISIYPDGSDTIVGNGVLELNESYSYVELVYHNGDWHAVLPFMPVVRILDGMTEITTLTGSSVSVDTGGVYEWTPSASSNTLNIGVGNEGFAGSCDVIITLQSGRTVTAGSNLTFAQSLTQNKVNHCVVKWRGTKAFLVVDWTQSI